MLLNQQKLTLIISSSRSQWIVEFLTWAKQRQLHFELSSASMCNLECFRSARISSHCFNAWKICILCRLDHEKRFWKIMKKNVFTFIIIYNKSDVKWTRIWTRFMDRSFRQWLTQMPRTYSKGSRSVSTRFLRIYTVAVIQNIWKKN